MRAWRVRLARMLVEEARHSILYGNLHWAGWCLLSAESALVRALTESVPVARPGREVRREA